MSNHRQYGSWIASAILACFAANSVQASELSCVQRAIDWNQASTKNYVVVSLVSLHETGEGSYASGNLVNSICNRPVGTVSCLISPRPMNALLLHPLADPKGLLSLAVDGIPSDTLYIAEVHLRQPNATYDFTPSCVGNLLVGNDQWGNHWTVSFGLGTIILN